LQDGVVLTLQIAIHSSDLDEQAAWMSKPLLHVPAVLPSRVAGPPF